MCCYIWCAMDPIKKKTLYVSIFLPAPWILGVFALELWLSTDTLWDDPPRSEQELLQQIQSTEPHFIRSLPYWQKPRSSFFLGPKKVPTWEWLKMSLYPFWKKGNETCLCWSFLNYQSMLFGVPPYLTLHCWICVGQWHTGSGPPTCKLVYNGIYIILDIYIYILHIYLYIYIYDIWDMYIIIYIYVDRWTHIHHKS